MDDLPDTLIERVQMLENTMTESATGGSGDDAVYEYIRRELMSDPILKGLTPEFVRTCRSLKAFWPYIKNAAGTYAERRFLISQAFTPLVEALEEKHSHPGDQIVSDAIATFEPENVHATWQKALSRRSSDPEGAITIARMLLEAVCKHILDAKTVKGYAEKDDLPALYRKAAQELNLAPDQHTEEPIKAILGGATSLVNGLGTLRNRFSDSHGRGARFPVKPSPRHASLAVNIAGAMALFLIETYHLKDEQRS